jgi:hypothetical protein
MSKPIYNEEVVKIIDAQQMSQDIWSEPIAVKKLDNIGVELSWTGFPEGTFEAYGSNSKNSWGKLKLVQDDGVTEPSTDDGSPVLLNLNQVPYSWVRLKYVFVSGSGTLTAFATAKAT